MSQVTSGIHAILSKPAIYNLFQNAMGAVKVRRDFVKNFVKPAKSFRILDIGCGTAEILHCLPADTEYWGYDISPQYIEAARDSFGSRGHFHCGLIDSETLISMPKFDIVLAIGVLHHLNDDEAHSLFALASEALKEDGRMVTLDPCFADGQNPIARYLIGKDRGQNVREAEGYRALAAVSFSNIHGVLRHRAWIPYTHWIMECTR
ncbi:MAG: class I SAM-dependent methyltransferase [Sideroxydans sp.]|nr:class I SAM-dependent methyltransferase [Sideroxydans sp.]